MLVNRRLASVSIRLHRESNVLLCWPPYDTDDGLDAVMAVADGAKGRVLYYVGEGRGGCCGSDCMFDLINRDFEEVEDVRIPNFIGLHDSMVIYRKK